MSKITFRYLKNEEKDMILPQLFAILHENMSKLAPTGDSYEEDEKVWLSYIQPALQAADRKILLMYAGEALAGYCQYAVNRDTLVLEEIEISPRYQRTMVFYRFCQYMLRQIGEEVTFLSSYVNKQNTHSLSLHESLGMERIGENKSGTSWQYRGERERILQRFTGRRRVN